MEPSLHANHSVKDCLNTSYANLSSGHSRDESFKSKTPMNNNHKNIYKPRLFDEREDLEEEEDDDTSVSLQSEKENEAYLFLPYTTPPMTFVVEPFSQ